MKQLFWTNHLNEWFIESLIKGIVHPKIKIVVIYWPSSSSKLNIGIFFFCRYCTSLLSNGVDWWICTWFVFNKHIKNTAPFTLRTEADCFELSSVSVSLRLWWSSSKEWSTIRTGIRWRWTMLQWWWRPTSSCVKASAVRSVNSRSSLWPLARLTSSGCSSATRTSSGRYDYVITHITLNVRLNVAVQRGFVSENLSVLKGFVVTRDVTIHLTHDVIR